MPGPPLRPALRAQDSSFESNESVSTTKSSISFLPAPTPFNTYIEHPSDDVLYNPDSAPSIDPSVTPTTSHNRSYTSQTHSTSYLLQDTSVGSVPHSTRPVPAPPLSLRNSGNDINSTASTLGTPGGTDGKVVWGDSVEAVGGDRSLSQVERDDKRLQQLGYDQVLGRDYTFWSSLSISTVNIGCLQGVIYGVYGAYSYGGPMMFLVAWPLSGFFSLFLVLALSELASAYPVSGAMASWSWKLARGGIGGERGWGWMMGGFVLGGHLANALLVTWQITNIISGTMQMAFEYDPQPWHGVCFYLGVMVVCGVVGSTGWGRSHRFWLACGAYFIAVYLILNVSILTTVVKHPEHYITKQFFNTTGWSSKAYVYILGWQFCTIATGADASAHMAEETQRPSRNVPNAMVCSLVVNYVLGYISMVLLLLAVRSEDIVELSKHHFPFGRILASAINLPGAIAICALLIVLLTFQVLAQLQASSRFVFALARDNAMPFAESIRWTNSSKQPIIANWVVIALCIPFCLLTIAGKGTLYSVLAVTAMSLSYVGYLVPVILYLLSGKDLQTEGRTSWSLRWFSKPAGCIGILYGLAVIVTQMFPGKRPISAQNVSWSPLVLVGTGLICLLTWRLYGNKHYSGPIRALTKWETGVEIDLQSALASSRSRPTDRSADTPRGTIESESILPDKTYDAGKEDSSHTVSIRPASGLDSEWTEWTDATDSGVPELESLRDERSTWTRSGGRVITTVGRVSEESER